MNINIIIIDPLAKTCIASTLDASNTLRSLYTAIGCDTVDCLDLGEGVDVWFDDEGLLRNDWSALGFTRFCGAITLGGVLVLAGLHNSKTGDLPKWCTPEYVAGMLSFPNPKKVTFPAPTITTQNEDGSMHTETIGEPMTFENH